MLNGGHVVPAVSLLGRQPLTQLTHIVRQILGDRSMRADAGAGSIELGALLALDWRLTELRVTAACMLQPRIRSFEDASASLYQA